MYFVYVLRSKFGKLYIGHTNNLERRVAEHNLGFSRYTSRVAGPWALVYKEPFNTRSGAMKRERELKTGKGRDYLKNFLHIC